MREAPAPRAPTTRLGRAATFAFGAAVATTLSVTGCAKSEERSGDAGASDQDAGVDSGGLVPAYGAPQFDAGPAADAAVAVDAGSDGGDSGGGTAPLYGAPPES